MQGQALCCSARAQFCQHQQGSVCLHPWKLGSGSFPRKLSSPDLPCCTTSPTHGSPIPDRPWFLVCVFLSRWSSPNKARRCCSQEHWRVREDGTWREGPRPSRQPKRWLSLPSKELALQAYSVPSTISLQARLHKVSEEVSVRCSMGAIHRDALFLWPVTLCLLCVTCPWGKGWAEEKQLTPGVRTKGRKKQHRA